MKTVWDVDWRSLWWAPVVGPTWTYQLQAGNEVVAQLSGLSSPDAVVQAEAADGHWTFRRTGLAGSHVEVRTVGSMATSDQFTIAQDQNRNTTVRLPSGRALLWQPTDSTRAEWAFTDSFGEHIIWFGPRVSGGYAQDRAIRLELAQAARAVPELSLLILLGWYFLVSMPAGSLR